MHDAHQRHWYTTCLLLGGAVPAAAKLSLQREDAQKRRSLAELRFFVREAVAGFTNRPNLLRLTDQPGKELGGLGGPLRRLWLDARGEWGIGRGLAGNPLGQRRRSTVALIGLSYACVAPLHHLPR